MPDFDSHSASGKPPHSDSGQAPAELGDDVLQAGLTELNRRLRELKEDLTGTVAGETDSGAEAPYAPQQRPSHEGSAAPQAQPTPPVPEPRIGAQPQATQAPSGAEDPEQRVHSILGTAQQMADEIMRNARQQVASSRQGPPSVPPQASVPAGVAPQASAPPRVPPEITDAAQQAAGALRYTQELLGFGQELLSSTRSVLEALEQGALPAQAATAPPPAQPQWGSPEATPHPAPAAAPSPPANSESQPSQAIQSLSQPPRGVYPPMSHIPQPPAPTPSATQANAAPVEPPAPTSPLVHHGQVTLTAGPLADVAAAAVFERAVERIPAVARARVKRFVDDRAVIELTLLETVTLADELRRVLPYPFEVQALGRSELDIAIVTNPESDAGGADGHPHSGAEV